MTKFRNIVEDIYLLETPANGVWTGIILVDGKERILIDSGINAENIDSCLVPALREMGYELKDVDWLLNTHCHGDHVGGHRRILELADIKVATYRESVLKLRDPLKYAKLIRATYPEHSPAASSSLSGVEESVVLEDGEIVAQRLLLVATPGHDTDCVCFYDLQTRTLITGDSLQGNGTATQGTALYISLTDYRDSLTRLEGMDICNIVSGHPYLFCGDLAIGREAAKNYLARCREITKIYDEFLSRQVEKGETDTAVLAKELIAHMGNQYPAHLFLPMYTVDAHLREMK